MTASRDNSEPADPRDVKSDIEIRKNIHNSSVHSKSNPMIAGQRDAKVARVQKAKISTRLGMSIVPRFSSQRTIASTDIDIVKVVKNT